MSQGCNFINSWMSASRRRASSVTPGAKTTNTTTSTGHLSGNSSSSSTTTTNIDRSKTNSTKNITKAGEAENLNHHGHLHLVTGRRASSSNDIPDDTTASSIASNLLAVGASTETICPDDSTQTGNKIKPLEGTPVYYNLERYSHHNQPRPLNQPLQVDIESPMDDEYEALFQEHDYAHEALEYEDPLLIDEAKLEDECREIESQIEEWERKVDELERKRFADDVPRTIVENVLLQKKKLRNLEVQLYALQLDSEDSDKLSGKTSYLTSPMTEEVAMILSSPEQYSSQLHHHHQQQHHYTQHSPSAGQQNYQIYESYHHHHQNRHKNQQQQQQQIYLLRDEESEQRLAAAKFGSNIKPGQENTADILNAIPPTGSLQYKQYLARASSGTDSSEYSRLPSFEPHRHQLQRSPRHQSRHRRHHQQLNQADQIYAQLSQSPPSSPAQTGGPGGGGNRSPRCDGKLLLSVSDNERNISSGTRVSPVRPDHFKDEFWPPHRVLSQDSSSTASSSSPH